MMYIDLACVWYPADCVDVKGNRMSALLDSNKEYLLLVAYHRRYNLYDLYGALRLPYCLRVSLND